MDSKKLVIESSLLVWGAAGGAIIAVAAGESKC